MEQVTRCPECGAIWPEGKTCQDDFYQMLFWEAEDPTRGEVHHLTVLCYHLQHPSLYSPEGLIEAEKILVGFLDEKISPAEMVKRNRAKVDSGKRNWKIKATVTSHGAYPRPISWKMTAADVVTGGPANYCENVRAWAQSILDTLKESGNLSRA